MTPLELELIDLGEHLDHEDGADLPVAVVRRIADERRGAPVWLKVAAALILALAIALVVPTSRRALARWLGIGAIEVRSVSTTLPVGPPAQTVPGSISTAATTATASAPTAAVVTTSSATTVPTTAATSATDPLAAARQAVTFRPLVAGADAGPIQRVDTDARVPGGLVAITYVRFTLVELASEPDSYPVMAKMAPSGVTVSDTTVNGVDGLWIGGAHEIAYLDPGGNVRSDTVRRSGSVLLWTVGSVTLRIEGFDTLEDALHAAATVG